MSYEKMHCTCRVGNENCSVIDRGKQELRETATHTDDYTKHQIYMWYITAATGKSCAIQTTAVNS